MTQRTLRWLRIPVNDKVCHFLIDRMQTLMWTMRLPFEFALPQSRDAVRNTTYGKYRISLM